MAKHTPNCKKCNEQGIRDIELDSYYCDKCDEWLEEKCSSTECEFCSKRPNKPSENNRER